MGSLCNLQRLMFDAALVRREFPPPHSAVTLVDALRLLGLGVHIVQRDGHGVALARLPCLVFLKHSKVPSSQSDHAMEASGLPLKASPPVPFAIALLVKSEGGRLLLFPAGTNEPEVVLASEFESLYAGYALEATYARQGSADEDDTGKHPAFGFRWFYDELSRHRLVWRDVLLASLFIQLIALATPLCSQVIIDKVIVHQTTSTLLVIASALAIFVLFGGALGWIRQYLVTHTGNRVDAVLGAAVFKHMMRLPLRYFEHRPTGVLAARLNGVETIREFLSGAAITLVLDLPFLLLFLTLMFFYSVWLSVITLGILALVVGLSVAVAPMLRARLNDQFMLGARNQAFVTEYVAGLETVKSLQMEPQLERRYESFLGAYLEANFSTRQLGNTYNTLASGLEQLLNMAILCLGAWLVMRGPDFTVGMLVAYQMFASRVSQPVLKLVGLWQQFQQATIAVRRLGDIMNVPMEPWSIAPAREGAGAGSIEFRDIGFRYAQDRPFVVRNFHLILAPGECVVVMGPSGAGKSTLTKLLQGFLLPTEGQVLLDGHDARHLAANELRGYFGVVPQETILFSGTILDNLLLANPMATFEMAVQAARLAEIHDTIESLPAGYKTDVGERGVGLSGGQKQRIAIARALLKRPRVLIFDEATSGLDIDVAEHFAATIARFKGKVTILFVTHRAPERLVPDRVVHLAQAEIFGHR
ncbi:MAG: peptidase domain-containing ABC transporter [Betaproteobacteria bacterium]